MPGYDENDYRKYRERYGPHLQEHFDLSLKAWSENPEIREAFPGFTTWNQSIREPGKAARRAEAHALIRRYTDYVIEMDAKGLPILRPGSAPDVAKQAPSEASPIVEAQWVEPTEPDTGRAKDQKKTSHARGANRSGAFVRCPACGEEFAVPPSALKKLAITTGSGVSGAAAGAAIGATYGAGVGIASGGTAMAGTIPLGVAGGLVGGAVLALGGKLGADFALAKVKCPSKDCGQEFRVRGKRPA
jgi:hypothetical protein